MASVLQKIVDRKHYTFLDKKVSWQEAIKLSCEPLVADGSVDANYHEQIVECATEYGPYFVFEHYVAMPHTQEDAAGIHKTSIGFMVCKEPIDFGKDEDGEQKEAKLFFTLASCDPNEHIDNISQLMEIFTNEPLLDALMNAKSADDILKAEKDFPNTEEDF